MPSEGTNGTNGLAIITETSIMKHTNVRQWFSETAMRFPTRTAIEHNGSHVTYEELEAKTNGLANLLLASGATKGSLVALMFEDRAEYIAAIIATLKAGCVFVPLDPETPQVRLEAMIAEVEPRWGLADAASQEKLARFEGLTVISDTSIYKDTSAPPLELDPDDL